MGGRGPSPGTGLPEQQVGPVLCARASQVTGPDCTSPSRDLSTDRLPEAQVWRVHTSSGSNGPQGTLGMQQGACLEAITREGWHTAGAPPRAHGCCSPAGRPGAGTGCGLTVPVMLQAPRCCWILLVQGPRLTELRFLPPSRLRWSHRVTLLRVEGELSVQCSWAVGCHPALPQTLPGAVPWELRMWV